MNFQNTLDTGKYSQEPLPSFLLGFAATSFADGAAPDFVKLVMKYSQTFLKVAVDVRPCDLYSPRPRRKFKPAIYGCARIFGCDNFDPIDVL